MDLRELQKTYLDNLRKVTEDKLEIGSLVRTVISIEEGTSVPLKRDDY